LRVAAHPPDSPIDAILAQGGALGLSDEQRRRLELADIDFRRKAIDLWNQQQLLILEMRQVRAEAGARTAPDPQAMAAVDAVTVKLRQLWLHTLRAAQSILSAEQLARVADVAGQLPGFDLDAGSPAPLNLAALVSEAVASRIKDSKVIEVETAQAIAERLIGWAKTAAIFTGIPLGLLVVVLTILGISNWADFSKRIDEGKKDVVTKIDDARQSISEVQNQAKAFQKEYADLKVQLGDVSGLKKDVSDLADKVKQLERIQFDQSAALGPEVTRAIERQITEFRSYLQSLGYQPPASDLMVSVDPKATYNAYYDGQKIVADPKLVTMPDVIFHEYTFRALNEINPDSWGSAGWKVQAIFYALSDYFPCSYLGESKMGQKFVELVPANVLPADMKKRGYLRDMLNKRKFVADSASEVDREMHNSSEPWSGLFWEIRTLFGCTDQTAKCTDADTMFLANAKAFTIAPVETADVRFARAIIDSVRQLSGAERANNVRAAFVRRGLTP
jgi:hypothetical protein